MFSFLPGEEQRQALDSRFEAIIEAASTDMATRYLPLSATTQKALLKILCLLDRAYYQVLDWKLCFDYEEVFSGQQQRRLQTVWRRDAQLRRLGSSDPPGGATPGEAEQNVLLARDAALRAATETLEIIDGALGPLMDAYAVGLIGGLGARLVRGKGRRPGRDLPCYLELRNALGEQLGQMGVPNRLRAPLIEDLLFDFFQTWYSRPPRRR